MKKIFVLWIAPALLQAQIYYWFANTQVNYLDWTDKTESDTTQKDFFYLSIEGGAGWKWGEIYSIANIENPNRNYHETSTNNLRYTAFGDFDIKLHDGFRIHFQDFFLHGYTYHVNDFVVGLSYKYRNKQGFWIKPFLGIHRTNDSFYDGWNGYMTGWVFDLPFTIMEQNFSLAQWNEIEFERDKKFYLDNDGAPIGDGSKWGLNGALSLWWYPHRSITFGIQYRYAKHKLGFLSYQSALITTLKINFH